MSLSTVTVTVAPFEAVRLTAPVDGATYAPGTVIPLIAVAPPGSTVEFLCNGTLVGTKTVAPYTLSVKLSAGVKVFAVRLKAAVVPPPVIVPPAPTVASPDGTQGVTVMDSTGGLWTIGPLDDQGNGQAFRNGIHMGGGYVSEYGYDGGVYGYKTGSGWWEWSGAQWSAIDQAEVSVRPFRGRRGGGGVYESDALTSLPLVTETGSGADLSLVYDGSFNAPQDYYPGGSGDAGTFSYQNAGMAFNPAGNSGAGSLFMFGHTTYGRIGEMTIPTPIIGTVASLNMATILYSDLVDPTNGTKNNACGSCSAGMWSGGALVFNNNTELLVSFYDSYDTNGASNSQLNSHWRLSSNLANVAASTQGPCNIHDPDISETTLTGRAGWVSGQMAHIPVQWQSAFGGFKHLTGHFGTSIIARTSQGPTATAFNAEDVGASPALGKRLVGYPTDHTTLGPWSGSNPVYGSVAGGSGMAFVKDTRSLLFFGRHGTGDHCYGLGQDDPELHHTEYIPGQDYCYDLTNHNTGQHDFPYHHQIWAYDALDLKDVYNGVKQYWEIVPYAYWTFTVPYLSTDWWTGSPITAFAYDQATQRVFLAVYHTPTDASSTEKGTPLVGGFGTFPIIHVYHFE